MSLKGISKRTVANLIGLLDQLEELEKIVGANANANDCDQIRGFREDLSEAYRKYEGMVSEITTHIAIYQSIYNKVRLRFVPEKLKSLRRIIPQDSNEFVLLKESIRKSHLT